MLHNFTHLGCVLGGEGESHSVLIALHKHQIKKIALLCSIVRHLENKRFTKDLITNPFGALLH